MNCVQSLLCWLDQHAGFGSVAQWVSAIVAIAALLTAFFSARWAIRQWHLRFLTEEWIKTHEFLFTNVAFQDPGKNPTYAQSYLGIEKTKYELVARRSIAYVDDICSLGMKSYFESWLKGSVDLFVKPHRQWYLDHKGLYSDEVNAFIGKELS